jgi:ribonuclease D
MKDHIEPEEVESVLLAQPRLPMQLVETTESLKSFLLELSKTNEPIALDAERASGFKYGQRAYLLQIAIKGSGIFLIDPVADFETETWSEFIREVSSKPWLIHAASQDLPCLTELTLKPIKILDTELAARLLGLPRVALGTLTEHYLQLKLAKEHSAVDWSERPLPDNWLNYAALDVDVLFELWDAIEEDLSLNGKSEIAAAEFNYLLIPNTKPPKVDRWRSMTGLHEVKDERALTVAKHLWEAREELAIEKDIAPGRLVPDASLVAAVKAAPRSRSELASLKTFAGRASRTFIDTWWKAIEDGNHTKNLVEVRPKPTGIPNHRNWPQKFPEAHARLLAAKEFIARVSEEQKIPQENILNPDTLRQICFEPPLTLTAENLIDALSTRMVRQWQIDFLLEGLLLALAATPKEPKNEELDSPS